MFLFHFKFLAYSWHSSQYHVMRWASKKVTYMFQRQKLPQDCPKYHQCYETKVKIYWFMIFQDSVLMQLSLDVKFPDHVKRRRTNVERNNVSYSIRHCSYALHFKTVVIKYAEQTNNCEAGRICSISWVKHPKVERTKTELRPILCKNCHLYRFRDRIECQRHAMSLLSERLAYLWGY
jgi:hypothetical protein